jgi:hypothetical protein
LSKAFFASIERIMWFLSLLLFMCCITFMNLHMLNHSCIPGMKLTWSSFKHVRVCLPVFCWESLHLYSLKILVYIVLFSGYVFGFGMSVILASQNEFGSVPSLSISWKSLKSIDVSSSLKFW